MPDHRDRRRGGHLWAIMGIAAVVLPGCVSGSLASNTGPRKGKSSWSTAPHQRIHVGETVRFDFVLTAGANGRMVDPVGVVDYCIVLIGKDRIIMDPDPMGHFRFEHTFDSLQPGARLAVQAIAYRVRGYRDFMKIAGEWIQSASPTDMPDLVVTTDSIALTAYQLTIQLEIRSSGSELDIDSGVLRIRTDAGREVSRYIDRPHRPGFTVHRPNARGPHLIRYQARGDELSSTGKTTVEFEIHDRSGKRIDVTRVFDTP